MRTHLQVEYYPIDQEAAVKVDGELPAVQRCLENWKKLK
jgi:hypothetical protein